MIASILATLVVSAIIFVTQLAAEGARVRKEALASKARRLRYRKDDSQVVAPPTSTPGGFHLFLSHVWGTRLTRAVRKLIRAPRAHRHA